MPATATQPSQTLDAFDQGAASLIRTFKSDGRSTVQLIEHLHHQWIVKTYHDPPLKTWLYHQLGCTPAWRELQGARHLVAAGVRVNVPALLRHRGGPLHARQLLLLHYVPGLSLYNLLYDDLPPDQQTIDHRLWRLKLARQIGTQVGQILAAGLIHRDYKPSNLIIDAPAAQADAQPMLIDVGSVRPGSGRDRLAMLLTLTRSSYQAGQVTSAERLAALRQIARHWPVEDLSTGQRLRMIVAAVTKAMGDPPPIDTPKGPREKSRADHRAHAAASGEPARVGPETGAARPGSLESQL